MKRLPNLLTLLRFVLTCFLNIYILGSNGELWIPIAVSCIIFATDFLDGKMARLLESASPFGAVFDVSADMFYIVASYGTLVYLGMAPIWFFPVFLSNFTAFAITSHILNKQSGKGNIFVFDLVGRHAAVLFYITPLAVYISYQLSLPLYHFVNGIFMYGVAAISFISSAYRILRCVFVKQLSAKNENGVRLYCAR